MKFFNVTACILLLLLILSAFFRIVIPVQGHSLNLFVLLGVLLSVNVFIILTFSSRQDGMLVSGWKKYAISFILLIFTAIISYSSIYLPLHSTLVTRISQQEVLQGVPITIFAESSKRYYIEVDASNIWNGTILNLVASKGEWQQHFQIKVAESRSNSNTGRSTMRSKLPFDFPENGEYSLSVDAGKYPSAVEEIRLFEIDAGALTI